MTSGEDAGRRCFALSPPTASGIPPGRTACARTVDAREGGFSGKIRCSNADGAADAGYRDSARPDRLAPTPPW